MYVVVTNSKLIGTIFEQIFTVQILDIFGLYQHRNVNLDQIEWKGVGVLLIVTFMLPGLVHENVIQKYTVEILISTSNLGIFACLISRTCTRCTGSSRELEIITYRGTS
jgi:hypothetical protein